MNRLSKKQLAVVEDLFAGELDEASVLAKHKVSTNLYEKWLADERFTEAFNKRVTRAHRQGLLIVARYAPLAASKLVQLTASDSPETARKACLDVLSMPRSAPEPVAGAALATEPALSLSKGAEAKHPTELSPETASRLLAALAKTQQNGECKE